jgi:hypothetical protein
MWSRCQEYRTSPATDAKNLVLLHIVSIYHDRSTVGPKIYRVIEILHLVNRQNAIDIIVKIQIENTYSALLPN